MKPRELNHSRLAFPSEPALKRKPGAVEVWNNTPDAGQPPHVVLNIEDDEGMHTVDLLPNEARAIAAMLIAAAASQESNASPSQE